MYLGFSKAFVKSNQVKGRMYFNIFGCYVHTFVAMPGDMNVLDLHCCRLQAIYCPIGGKNFVIMYTAFDPLKRGNLLLRLLEKFL